MDKLPSEVKRIDVLRVEYGKRKLCQCLTPHIEIDYQNKLVYCNDCGAILDPFEALYKLATHSEHLGNQVHSLLEQRLEISKYKPHLVTIKELERKYRANHFSMLPVCPRCNELFELTELNHWANRAFFKSGGEEK